MTHEFDAHGFDKDYWEGHWQEAQGGAGPDPHPYLAEETVDLPPGSALEAGCGEGAEATWLAARGWQVTAADISAEALARAAGRAGDLSGGSRSVEWVEADLGTWEPGRQFDLVTTFYAHPTIPQLDFYDRLATWVAPGGTLLVVGHLHTVGTTGHGHGHAPPAEASVTAATVTARLDDAAWEVVTTEERARTMTGRGGEAVPLRDVVVRARRRRPADRGRSGVERPDD